MAKSTKKMVASADADMLRYITEAEDHAAGVDLFTDKFFLTVRGCYDTGMSPQQCGRIIYAMFKAWHTDTGTPPANS